ncbi:MAG: MurR/RpiR family transcriptional regulator [Oscillospiraceae bacterium]|nr:MurR/RpiR family transcriptional regulator [Oscillospiraceae bacterium]
MEPQDIIQSVKARYHTMSPGHKLIADYILNHADEFIFQSSAQVGTLLGVSESTVVRFASALGYSRFKELQQALKGQVAGRLDIIRQFNQHTAGSDELFYPFQQDFINLEETIRELDPAYIRTAVDLILQARHIGVVALRGAIAPALILSQFLNELLDNSRLITPGNGDAYDIIKHWDHQDLLICCEFIPLEGFVHSVLTFGKQRGCKTISILGNLASSLFPLSDVILEVKKDGTFISYTAAVALVNTLLNAVSQRNSANTVHALEETRGILRLANGLSLDTP